MAGEPDMYTAAVLDLRPAPNIGINASRYLSGLRGQTLSDHHPLPTKQVS